MAVLCVRNGPDGEAFSAAVLVYFSIVLAFGELRDLEADRY